MINSFHLHNSPARYCNYCPHALGRNKEAWRLNNLVNITWVLQSGARIHSKLLTSRAHAHNRYAKSPSKCCDSLPLLSEDNLHFVLMAEMSYLTSDNRIFFSTTMTPRPQSPKMKGFGWDLRPAPLHGVWS